MESHLIINDIIFAFKDYSFLNMPIHSWCNIPSNEKEDEDFNWYQNDNAKFTKFYTNILISSDVADVLSKFYWWMF